MSKLGIDFKKVAMKAGGHAGGVITAGKIYNAPIMQKITNPTMRALALAGIGYVGIPWLANKAKLNGKDTGAIVEAFGDGVGIMGTMQFGRAKAPNLFPAISGYEANPTSLGALIEENGMNGLDDDGMSGMENPIDIGSTDEEVNGLNDAD